MPRSNKLVKTEEQDLGNTETDTANTESVVNNEVDESPKKKTTPKASKASSTKNTKTPKSSSKKTKGNNEVADSAANNKGTPRILQLYRSSVKDSLTAEFGYKNVMELPSIKKVVINIGMAEVKNNPKAMENATKDLGLITGQKPVITKAKKSVAGFKLREGEPIGTSVTLRGRRMYEFIDRLLNAALPRIRDFRGVSNRAFDGRGNYSLGIREHVIFPEIDYGQIDRVRGLQVSIVTSAKTDLEAMRLLDLLGMPFVKENTTTVAKS
jgi:large subunit ribosomal protein L5|tara:strand:- start:886 stop:1689 length:804 start_codon:yes stop_codon:yes gene_type:complete